jgi:hypothetical protein
VHTFPEAVLYRVQWQFWQCKLVPAGWVIGELLIWWVIFGRLVFVQWE